MKTMITLYLADDHQIVIDGLKLLISNEETMKVIGSANDGNTAYTEISAQKPDIALVDLRMPGMSGLDLVYKLSRIMKTQFVILSMQDDKRSLKDAFNGGAAGYLLKNFGKEELVKCIHSVLKGEKYFRMLPSTKDNINKPLFTPRESEIVKLVIDGHTTAEIANQLALSSLTVDTHRKNIGRKTNTNTVLGLHKFIIENKIET